MDEARPPLRAIAPHGSPYDRGDADAYYGRRFRPHKWLDDMGVEEATDLSVEEIEAYTAGFDDNPSGRKPWGDAD
ncbi:hypothetical protein [Frigidibacter oleivorans]|uniref:hypothetical protein n=1 Tax=Frigidibacter oleivorans TaxID=2487129 RepID=UPI000F8DC86E|nr:hypothetical protein [Frigidibacter oleivorans]